MTDPERPPALLVAMAIVAVFGMLIGVGLFLLANRLVPQ